MPHAAGMFTCKTVSDLGVPCWPPGPDLGLHCIDRQRHDEDESQGEDQQNRLHGIPR